MKKLNLVLVGLILLFGIAFLTSYCSPRKISKPNPTILPTGNLAANNPDQFAWELFARTFQPADNDEANVLWENWASKYYTYKNPCGPRPPWPEGRQNITPGAPKIQNMIQKLNESGKVFYEANLKILTLSGANPFIEEVRYNRPMFDYIVGNELYDINNVYDQAKTSGIEFPSKSIVLKVQWKKLSANELEDYYWRELQHKDKLGRLQKDTLGLVAFHIVSKELPNWVWTTFEHVKNAGRCDIIGCSDEFGVSPNFIKPHPVAAGKQYAPGKMTPALKALFEKYNIDPIFKNYQLRGTQTEYTDNKGQATILGNSVLEANFVETSSCITCHAYSALNGGLNSIVTFKNPDSLVATFELGIKPSSTFGFHPECFTGTPETDLFYPQNSKGIVPPDSIYYQLDFMWQLVHNSAPCENEDVN